MKKKRAQKQTRHRFKINRACERINFAFSELFKKNNESFSFLRIFNIESTINIAFQR